MVGAADNKSPQTYARLAGFLSLITLAAGIFAEVFVLDAIVVPGDAAATANNTLASEPLYRFGFAAYLVDYTFYIGVTVILYGLFKPVSRNLSLLAAVFSVLGTAVVVSASLYYLAPLALLAGAPYLNTLETDQLQALALLSLKLRTVSSHISLVFFGLHLLFVGWLIVRSTFLPRFLGVLSAIGGTSFVISSLANFLSPPFAAQLLPYILAPGVLAQASLAVWLLVMGVNAARWREQEIRQR